VLPGLRPDTLIADLRGLDPGAALTLFLETGGAPAFAARFDFRAAAGAEAGLIRSKTIIRHPGQVATGRFYMPLSGLWPTGAASVEIVLDVPFGPVPRVTACAA